MQRSLMCSYSIPPLSPHTPHTPHTHAHFSQVRNPGLEVVQERSLGLLFIPET
ncbi:hypothetical protein [Nostoc sp. C110]|uniref:hypothetical protein n=1 Tax=Nostoc sp. C110 TaxID=3349876 RepID=UPI00370DBCAB